MRFLKAYQTKEYWKQRRGWEHEFAGQDWGPQFDPIHPHKKFTVVGGLVIPMLIEKAETGGSLEFADPCLKNYVSRLD